MDRQKLIAELFDTMDSAKRSMRGRLLTITNGRNISHTQLELLISIRHAQPVSPKRLAEKLCMTAGAVSQLTQALDQQQLITRETDPADRRRHVLRISRAGADLLKEVEKRRRTVMDNVIRDLSDEELAAWLHIQRKLIHEFRAAHAHPDEKEKP